MKLYIVIFAVVLVGVAMALPAKDDSKRGTPSPAFQKKPCIKKCTFDYTPVCGAEGSTKKSFGNLCVLENYNCENGASLKKISDGECPGGGGVRLS